MAEIEFKHQILSGEKINLEAKVDFLLFQFHPLRESIKTS